MDKRDVHASGPNQNQGKRTAQGVARVFVNAVFGARQIPPHPKSVLADR